MKREDKDSRCSSGVPGFDEISHGGFVRNTTNIIVGGPGAGKTTFLLQFLYDGATTQKENGLFISFEPELGDLQKDALALGWDFEKLEKEKKCTFLRIPPSASIDELKGEVLNLLKKKDIQRVCFDPASFFGAMVTNEARMRAEVYELMAMFKKTGVTILLSAEASPENESFHNTINVDYLKFLSDSVVELYSSGLGGVSDRAIRIIKMRRTSHERGPIPFEISAKGVRVLSKKR